MCGNKKQKEYDEVWKEAIENPKGAFKTYEQRILFKCIGYAVDL